MEIQLDLLLDYASNVRLYTATMGSGGNQTDQMPEVRKKENDLTDDARAQAARPQGNTSSPAQANASSAAERSATANLIQLPLASFSMRDGRGSKTIAFAISGLLLM
jgi:hypothetical protein